MKKILLCKWEVAPGDGEKTRKFNSYKDANIAIRNLICENIDITDCVNKLKKEGNFLYIKAVTDFLIKYFSDPLFPYSESDLPSCHPFDYEDCDSYPDGSKFLTSEGESLDYFEVERDRFTISYGGYNISSDFLLDMDSYKSEDHYSDLSFEFENENGWAKSNKANDMSLHLSCEKEWGTSAYPIMILKVLQESQKPLLQADIAEQIMQDYKTYIERKTIGRNIHMLIDLGYDIQKNKFGYFLHTETD